eukprot:CAMPEP_0197665944 /NCGR_PEP_ID=MMETSP1338-20131121/60949_1 /TAXON_ID=43686 ORGANISM="Pelagodinium beii, Strain RCC1491" /NCGR_SAMPLE_ID=MMETSP1338 /ASSEMBLY_ACC=CAM_ASM_000754 /LENGTH=303 /DNA_ID=CAMNT_0043244883 /DNA_START=39 /DNA_END=950 /DNA_ORIENTATION=-
MKPLTLLLAMLVQNRPQRKLSRCVAAKAAKRNAQAEVKAGYKSRIGEDGRLGLRPGVQHIVPTAAAGSTGLPEAASAHRHHYDLQRGPRFRHLPPPIDAPYSSQHGAFQPALLSRLDATEDLRVENMGAELPPTADTTCLVPEPYCHAQRPDQRVRAAAAFSDDEDIIRSLEKKNQWHQPRESRLQHHDSLRYCSDATLRKLLQAEEKPVSGNREALLARLRQQDMLSCWTKPELMDAAGALGLQQPYAMTRHELVQAVSAAWEANKFAELSLEDLHFECVWRDLPVHGSKEELVARLSEPMK